MTKTLKIIVGIIILILVVWGAYALISDDQTTDMRPVVKIGLVFPLTGNVAFLGESAKNAAELALKDAGMTKNEYKLVFEDDQFDPVKSATAANKLTSIDKVFAFISFGSGTGNAAAPIAEASKTPHFSLASDPTSAKGEYNYIHWTPPFKEGELLAKELIRRGYKKVSIVDTNHSGTLAVTKSIQDALKGSNVKVVSYDLTNVGDKDFRTLVSKIKGVGPEIVVLEMFSPEIEIMARQMKELALNVPLTSVETFEWSSNPELFEGYWFISDAKVGQAFKDDYSSAYKSDPKPGASYIYDLVTLLIDMQESSSQPISAIDFPEVLGRKGSYTSPIFGNIKIDEEGFFLTEASVKEIKGGAAKLVQ